MGHRHRARELALQALYSAEMTEGSMEETLADVATWRDYSPAALSYATRLAQAVQQHRQECTSLIRENATNWELSRIAMIDRLILQMGICELLFMEDVPSRVAIDEAIELAKAYSTEKSGGFINGILDSILKQRKPAEEGTPGDSPGT